MSRLYRFEHLYHLILNYCFMGYGHNFGNILFFYFYCLNAFLISTVQNLSASRRGISRTQSSQFFFMQIRLVPCFYLHCLNHLPKSRVSGPLSPPFVGNRVDRKHLASEDDCTTAWRVFYC